MDDLEQEKRRRIAEANPDRCPNCGKPLGPDRVGSGRLSDGMFCGLGCQAIFHKDYYGERARATKLSDN